MLYSSAVSLIAARGYFFCLETKEAKFKSPPYASLPHKAFTLQSEAAPRAV
jgi:YHS domain-containing protein